MDFSKLTAYMDSLAAVGVPGCDLAIYRDHAPLYRHMAGCADAEGARPLRGNETYCLYSCSKVFTTCAAMQLIGQGRMNLDDPVAEWLPAYAHLTVRDGASVRPARRTMTVRHLMSMQSGLNYDLNVPAIQAVLKAHGSATTTRQLVDALAQEPLNFEPGTDFLYSLSHDVLAAVIEAASGQRFSDYLREHIFEPLKLKSTGFELTEARAKRMCAQYVFDAATGQRKLDKSGIANFQFSANYESGGAGLISDVQDCIALADALACGGETADGARILEPRLIQLWSANQLCPRGRQTFDQWQRLGYSYGLGVRTRVSLEEGGPGQIGEFGWDGAACAWMMIDPHNHLSAFFAMHMRDFPYAYDVIHPTLRSMIYEAVRGKD